MAYDPELPGADRYAARVSERVAAFASWTKCSPRMAREAVLYNPTLYESAVEGLAYYWTNRVRMSVGIPPTPRAWTERGGPP